MRCVRLVMLLLVAVAIGPRVPSVRAQAGSNPPPPPPNVVVPGEVVVEPPTLINLGFEWFIEGDANRNASVLPPAGRSHVALSAPAPAPRR
jgi:hypothetical protein